MDKIHGLGTDIQNIVRPTMQVYSDILKANAKAIKSTKRETFQYGPHKRQALDVYYPDAQKHRDPANSPVLVFLYGGGLVRGDKTLSFGFDGLVHANIGHFFADTFGYTVIIPDYRLIEHGAKFPSGGEDVALVIEWIRSNLVDAKNLFIMGNSAGGIHLSTYLFAPMFAESRRQLVHPPDDHAMRLRGAMLLSVPFQFEEAHSSRDETLTAYYGDHRVENCPLGLLTAAIQNSGSPDVLPDVKFLVLNGTLDPDDEILNPKKDFLETWEKMESAPNRNSIWVEMMHGHNHISPPLSLGTGKADEEAWGHRVSSFIEGTLTPLE